MRSTTLIPVNPRIRSHLVQMASLSPTTTPRNGTFGGGFRRRGSVFLGLDPYLLALGDLQFGGSVLTLGAGFGASGWASGFLVRYVWILLGFVSESLLGYLETFGPPSGFLCRPLVQGPGPRAYGFWLCARRGVPFHNKKGIRDTTGICKCVFV